MSPRKAATDLLLGGPRVRRHDPPMQTGALTWQHTEFGRRTICETYHVVHQGEGWQLLDADWNPLAPAVRTIEEAMHQAERHAARAVAALPRGTARHASASGGD